MSPFTVTAVVDGNTFAVSPRWKWNDQSGNHIRPTGYHAPELHTYGGQAARGNLSRLILGRQVEIRTMYKIVEQSSLVCDVFFQDRYLADYFPEYQSDTRK